MKFAKSNTDVKEDIDMPRICSSNIVNAIKGKLG